MMVPRRIAAQSQLYSHEDDPKHILDISRRKQQEDKDGEDLHKAVLVSNTVKAAEKEIKNAILQALFFWTELEKILMF